MRERLDIACGVLVVERAVGRAGLPGDEALDRLVLGQAQGVVELGGGAVAVLGPLPELAGVVGPGEQGAVLLALVLEDRHAFAVDLFG